MLKDVHNRLRPLGIADILDETVEIYKSNFVLLVGISAFLYVPLLLTNVATNKQPKLDPVHPDMAVAFGYLGFMVLVGCLYALASWIVTGALAFGISERYLGRQTSIGACYRRILKPSTLFSFLAAGILTGLAVGAAFSLWGLVIVVGCFGVGVAAGFGQGLGGMSGIIALSCLVAFLTLPMPLYIALRLPLVGPAFVVEMRGITGSLGRSWGLMKGSMMKAFWLFLLVIVATTLIETIATMPFGMSDIKSIVSATPQSSATTVLGTIVQTILGTLLLPITSIVTILLYYDQRIRKEGFDLEVLAWELDATTREMAAQGPALPHEQIPPGAQYAEEPDPLGGGQP